MNKTGTLQTETIEVLRAESARLHALEAWSIRLTAIDDELHDRATIAWRNQMTRLWR